MQNPVASFLITMGALAMTTPAAADYRLLETIPVAGDEGWDHPTIDAGARRLYVTHGTHVVVLDADSGKQIGKIENTPGAHFTVIDPDLNRGFISNGGAHRLTIFDTTALKTITEVQSTGENPGPTVFDSLTKRVFTFNLNSNTATVVPPRKALSSVPSSLAESRNWSASMGREMSSRIWCRRTWSCRSTPGP
jgi:hypothetical protein